MVFDRKLKSLVFALAVQAAIIVPAQLPVRPEPATTVGTDAVVLVNSGSTKYLDFQHHIQPYLDNFGVPYTVRDIATNGVGGGLDHYAVIVIGHSQLDPSGIALGRTGQESISLAVSNGTGLVSFDGALLAADNTAGPSYLQTIFGFGFGAATYANTVALPETEVPPQMHYITALHTANSAITLRCAVAMPGVTLPPNVTALALCGAQPLLAITQYGQGCAAQWTSYAWMSQKVLGPLGGLDDLVWRSLVWAARKPFVMRSLPNLLTLRVDDVAGPFEWAHTAKELGFRPWLGLFLAKVAETDAADLRCLVTNGLATAAIHSVDCCKSFFYYDHSRSAPWPDQVMSDNFSMGTEWHARHGIPISKVVIAHYSEFGPNAFAGLRAWGVEFIGVCFPPGQAWYSNPPAGPFWSIGGPYRLYETPRSGTGNSYPTYYADFVSVPGHPEFDGQFFSCFTEIRDDAPCGEWCPDNDVLSSINRGTRQVKRAFDSLILGALYTHESNILSIAPGSWQAILQGITNNLAAYKPVFVTYDYACQYIRATRTSRLMTSDYDPLSGRVSVALSGKADLATQISVFVGQNNSITSNPLSIPAFLATTNNLVALLAPPGLAMAATSTNAAVRLRPTPLRGLVVQ